MKTFVHEGYTVQVEMIFSGMKHYRTEVSVFTLGPRGGRRPPVVPQKPDGIVRYGRIMSEIGALAKQHEKLVLEGRGS